MKEKRCRVITEITDLPHEVLLHILSFLRTKESIRTSLVAKSWRYLWKSVPSLNFDLYDDEIESVELFMMLRDGSDLREFRLRAPVSGDRDFRFSTCIKGALHMKAKVLHLEVEDDVESLRVPSSETLETLTVVARPFDVVLDMSTCFPLLKTIELTGVIFPSNLSTGFFSFFPSLETLLLDNVTFESSSIHIVSPSLRILRVKHNQRFDYEVHVWASHLASLEYECVDPRPGGFVIEGASSLVDAKITCWKSHKGEPWLGLMIASLSSVNKLTLNLSINQLFDLVEVVHARTGTSFSNLTCLTICLGDCNCKYCFDSAIYLLRRCPRLEKLFLRFKKDDHQPNSPQEPAAALRKLSMNHLRQVQVVADESYHSYDKIMAKWVELLVENSPNLDQITIKRAEAGRSLRSVSRAASSSLNVCLPN